AADQPRSSVQSAGVRRPCLKDGRELIVSYVGESRLVSQMQSGNARALSLASADFDGDGIPDLAAGYSLEPSGGVVAIHRGNPDAIYQNSAEAQARRGRGEATDSPFLSPPPLVPLPLGPAVLGTGDFNHDGQFDIVAAAKGGTAFYVLLGDGHGGFGQPVKIALPGRTTAMCVSDVNRRDGYGDILIGVTGTSGSSLLVFQ